MAMAPEDGLALGLQEAWRLQLRQLHHVRCNRPLGLHHRPLADIRCRCSVLTFRRETDARSGSM